MISFLPHLHCAIEPMQRQPIRCRTSHRQSPPAQPKTQNEQNPHSGADCFFTYYPKLGGLPLTLHQSVPNADQYFSNFPMMKWFWSIQKHVAARAFLLKFCKWFYTSLGPNKSMDVIQPITDICSCGSSNPSDSTNQGPCNSLPIPYCKISLLSADVPPMEKVGGYNKVLVVTCALP